MKQPETHHGIGDPRFGHVPSAPEPAPKPSQDPASLGTWLRLLGGTLIISAMSAFLIQNWNDQDDWVRYFILLAVTVVLGITGFLVGLRFSDRRGARALLGIVLSSVPIHFALTGGLLYSQFSLDNLAATTEAGTRWTAATPLQAWLPALVMLAVLTPLTVLAARVLFRAHARVLAPTFLLVAALIWVPIRDPLFASCLALVAFFIGFAGDVSTVRLGAVRKTLEARWTRALLYVPALLIWGRQFVIYDPHYFLVGTMPAAVAAVMLFQGSRLESEVTRKLIDILALFPVSITWVSLAMYLGTHSAWDPTQVTVLGSMGFFFTSLMLAWWRRESWYAMTLIGGMGAGIGLAYAGLMSMFYGEFMLWITLSVMVVATLVASASAWVRNTVASMIAGSAVLMGLIIHFALTLSESSVLGWGGLVAMGFLAIVAAANADRLTLRARTT